MIYDCFIFNGEFDILDIRLNELKDVVDYFVIIEGDHTFQGEPKELTFHNRMNWYSDLMPQIIYVTFSPKGNSTWEREAYSRDQVSSALRRCQPDDIILMGDADEIPRASVVKTLDPQEITLLNMDEYYYGLNLWHDYYGFVRACYFKDFPGGQAVRKTWSEDMPKIDNAGWHFSYLMTPEQIAKKIQSFSHDELNRPEYTELDRIAERIRTLQDPFDRDTLERRHFDDHPRYVLDNLDRFGKFIL
jgi:beta-1,4-mannosyl-glycoprotein beta-1,4-N-acetylglucosaminyltransferase